MQADDFGGPSALHPVEVDPGEPGPGRVRLRVRAAGVNPSDAKLLSGVFGKGRTPVRPGSEVSGVVTAVGADAVGPLGPLAVGDEVVGFRVSGGFAEEVVVPATSVLPSRRGSAGRRRRGSCSPARRPCTCSRRPASPRATRCSCTGRADPSGRSWCSWPELAGRA
ncbi:zinc-binding alcohol dehydrogenase family protein [Rathayibacter oskolensis]|uniref:quinone oxidoreductase family protein n=1 Tax=Rathayibacter oskolensis TaxID=1891671 RepID=UPI00265FBABD|nr:zinc-binding alcohol dehydrogenase family protein [Rathayibacter oskolensis]WKK70603.1 zinc-binding alcohol dehydrogenase family protein [Rathayibacter oskolensis]